MPYNLRNARVRSALRAHATARIVETYRAADDATRVEGSQWYPTMLTICEGIATDYALPVDRVAAAMAALSPQISVSGNIDACAAVCESFARDPAAFPRGSGQQDDRVETALRLLEGDNAPMDWTTNVDGTRNRSMKTRSFYRNILGDENEVTIDTWAARIALGFRPDRQPTGPLYLLLAEAYRVAAATLGLPPRVVQAIVWTHVRGSAW